MLLFHVPVTFPVLLIVAPALKNDVECSVACHTVDDLECGNLITLAQRTEVQDVERSAGSGRKRAASKATAPAITKAKKAKGLELVGVARFNYVHKFNRNFLHHRCHG